MRKPFQKKCSTGTSALGRANRIKGWKGEAGVRTPVTWELSRWCSGGRTEGGGGGNRRSRNYLNKQGPWLKKFPESFTRCRVSRALSSPSPPALPGCPLHFYPSLPHTPHHHPLQAWRLKYPLIKRQKKWGLFNFERQRPNWQMYTKEQGFPRSSAGKESACKAGDPGSILGSGRSPGEGKGYQLQYSWASLVAQMVKDPSAMRETWVPSLDGEDPLEASMATHSNILAWRIHGQRSPWGSKELDTTERLRPAQDTNRLTHTHTCTHGFFYYKGKGGVKVRWQGSRLLPILGWSLKRTAGAENLPGPKRTAEKRPL